MIDTYQKSKDKEGEEFSSFEAVYASNVREGDFLLIFDSADKRGLKPARVVKVETRVFSGVYAPLTSQGNLVVDNVLVSCYALIDSQTIAHLSFAPLRLWYNMLDSVPSLITPENFKSNDVNEFNELNENGIHWYANCLYSLAEQLMPSRLWGR